MGIPADFSFFFSLAKSLLLAVGELGIGEFCPDPPAASSLLFFVLILVVGDLSLVTFPGDGDDIPAKCVFCFLVDGVEMGVSAAVEVCCCCCQDSRCFFSFFKCFLRMAVGLSVAGLPLSRNGDAEADADSEADAGVEAADDEGGPAAGLATVGVVACLDFFAVVEPAANALKAAGAVGVIGFGGLFRWCLWWWFDLEPDIEAPRGILLLLECQLSSSGILVDCRHGACT